jgi:aminoglycoside phosphotransferase (APT) family kinase protein
MGGNGPGTGAGAGVGTRPVAEVDVDEHLAGALVAEQHPDLAGPLRLVASGWDNCVFRLGDDLCVRLPRRQLGADLVAHEQRWLPELAPGLPMAVPVPLRRGRPALGYPWPWSICRWVSGETALERPPAEAWDTAALLGRFVACLHRPAPPEAPVNPYRGVPLAARSDALVDRLDRVPADVDRVAVEAAWVRALAEDPWSGPAVWLHGDLHPGNLIVLDGHLAGVIDFGDLTSGDPATDLAVAWMLLPPEARGWFREAAGEVDDATWGRARGWALALAVAVLGHSADDPAMAGMGRRTLDAVLADGPA